MPTKSPRSATTITKARNSKKAPSAMKSKGLKSRPKENPAPAPALRKKRTPGKTSEKLTPSFTLESKEPSTEPVIAHDDIALRAYFLAELRHKMGWPGDPSTDWADAVKQLRIEALEKPLKKR